MSMNMNSTSKRPSHRICAVQRKGEKSYWTDIGAAWAHADGKGFSLKLDYLPLNGADLVLRVPEEKSDENKSAQEGGEA